VTLRLWRAAAMVCASIACAALPATAAPNAQRGAELYARCAACHALAHDRVGPRHCGLLGRRAGSVRGYDYSAAMRRSKMLWTAETLNRFLADPPGTVPGTSMTYAGVNDATERADLIAYLQQADRSAACLQQQPPRQ
jgi:cytochrome c